jgi:hypothetical protein
MSVAADFRAKQKEAETHQDPRLLRQQHFEMRRNAANVMLMNSQNAVAPITKRLSLVA